MKQVYINCVMPTIEMFKIESITTDRAVAIQEFNKHPLKKSYNEIRYVLFYIEMSDADYNKLISIPPYMLTSSKSTSPVILHPSTKSFIRLSDLSKVDFPQPEGPIKAVI